MNDCRKQRFSIISFPPVSVQVDWPVQPRSSPSVGVPDDQGSIADWRQCSERLGEAAIHAGGVGRRGWMYPMPQGRGAIRSVQQATKTVSILDVTEDMAR